MRIWAKLVAAMDFSGLVFIGPFEDQGDNWCARLTPLVASDWRKNTEQMYGRCLCCFFLSYLSTHFCCAVWAMLHPPFCTPPFFSVYCYQQHNTLWCTHLVSSPSLLLTQVLLVFIVLIVCVGPLETMCPCHDATAIQIAQHFLLLSKFLESLLWAANLCHSHT